MNITHTYAPPILMIGGVDSFRYRYGPLFAGILCRNLSKLVMEGPFKMCKRPLFFLEFAKETSPNSTPVHRFWGILYMTKPKSQYTPHLFKPRRKNYVNGNAQLQRCYVKHAQQRMYEATKSFVDVLPPAQRNQQRNAIRPSGSGWPRAKPGAEKEKRRRNRQGKTRTHSKNAFRAERENTTI